MAKFRGAAVTPSGDSSEKVRSHQLFEEVLVAELCRMRLIQLSHPKRAIKI